MSRGGGRHTHGCNCRDDKDDEGDTRIGKGNGGGGVTGGQWLQWGGMERGGRLRHPKIRCNCRVENDDDGDTRIGIGNGGGGVTEGQWLQWGGMERSGGLRRTHFDDRRYMGIIT